MGKGKKWKIGAVLLKMGLKRTFLERKSLILEVGSGLFGFSPSCGVLPGFESERSVCLCLYPLLSLGAEKGMISSAEYCGAS